MSTASARNDAAVPLQFDGVLARIRTGRLEDKHQAIVGVGKARMEETPRIVGHDMPPGHLPGNGPGVGA